MSKPKKSTKLPKNFALMSNGLPFTKQNLHSAARFANFSQWFYMKLSDAFTAVNTIKLNQFSDDLAQEIWDYIHKK